MPVAVVEVEGVKAVGIVVTSLEAEEWLRLFLKTQGEQGKEVDLDLAFQAWLTHLKGMIEEQSPQLLQVFEEAWKKCTGARTQG